MNQVKPGFKPVPFSFDSNEYVNMLALSNAIAQQIWHEQQLISTRMRWNFAIQGFLGAIIVYFDSDFSDGPRLFIQISMAIAGLFVNLFILLAIQAAQQQSTRLRTHWVNIFAEPATVDVHTAEGLSPLDCDLVEGGFVQPFSPRGGSKQGRFSSTGICWLLFSFWILVIVTLAVNFELGIV